jgi:hypothetical protein
MMGSRSVGAPPARSSGDLEPAALGRIPFNAITTDAKFARKFPPRGAGGCANGFWHLSEEAVIRQVFADDSHFQDDPLMLPSDLDRVTPFQRLIIEQAFVLAKELENAVESAPKGQVVDRCESLLLGHGRDFLRRALESSLQSRAEALEKKGEPAESAPAERRVATRATRPGR